jgi:mitogen-activated protein kinase kinase
MAKSNSQPANIEAATSALSRATLADHAPPHTMPRMPPQLLRGGLNGRRRGPGLKLSQIDPDAVPPPSSGGSAGAGLGAGRPSMAAPPKRSSTMASPFANFSKIVFVSVQSYDDRPVPMMY